MTREQKREFYKEIRREKARLSIIYGFTVFFALYGLLTFGVLTIEAICRALGV